MIGTRVEYLITADGRTISLSREDARDLRDWLLTELADAPTEPSALSAPLPKKKK